MKKLILFIIFLFISRVALADEVFLKCNYNGENFTESKELSNKLKLSKAKPKLGVEPVLLTINKKNRTAKISGYLFDSSSIPIRHETNKYFYISNLDADPSKFYMEDPLLDFSDILGESERYRWNTIEEANDAGILDDLKSIGMNFNFYEKLSVWALISLDRTNLNKKISLLFEGVDKESKMVEAIGIYDYRFKCKKTEQLL